MLAGSGDRRAAGRADEQPAAVEHPTAAEHPASAGVDPAGRSLDDDLRRGKVRRVLYRLRVLCQQEPGLPRRLGRLRLPVTFARARAVPQSGAIAAVLPFTWKR